MPRYEEGDTYETILQKAEESISGTNDIMISLGGYGGYVTFGFDHTVINIPGEKDFRIWGNAFYELLNPDQRGGSAEPGIVMVSYGARPNRSAFSTIITVAFGTLMPTSMTVVDTSTSI